MNKKTLAIILLVVVSIFIVVVIFSRSDFKKYAFQETSLSSQQNFGYMQDDKLYSYNGMVFSEYNLLDGNIRVLHTGTRLPAPKKIYWAADNGVLISFKQSFIGTEVERILQQQGKTVNRTTMEYVWFLNFKTGKLQQVEQLGDDVGTGTHIPSDGLIYFTSLGTINDEFTPLISFSTDSGEVERITNLPIIDISYVGDCAQEKLCIVGRDAADKKNVQLYSMKISEQNPESVLSVQNTISPTNNPDIFVITDTKESGEEIELASGDEHGNEDVDPVPGVLSFYNISTGARDDGLFEVSGDIISSYIDSSSGDFLIINNALDEDSEYLYYSGRYKDSAVKATEYPVIYGGEKDDTPIFISSNGQSGRGYLLLSDDQGTQVIAKHPSLEDTKLPEVKQYDDIRRITEDCPSLIGKPIEQQYFEESRIVRIFLQEDTYLQSNIQKIAQCIGKEIKNTWSYNFKISTLDPTNGRITSD